MGDKQTVPLIWGGVDDLREQLIRAHAEIVRMHDLADQQQAARRAAGDEIERMRPVYEAAMDMYRDHGYTYPAFVAPFMDACRAALKGGK